jgi:hypothetical protein
MLVSELVKLLQDLDQDMEVEMAMNMEYQSDIEAHLVREVMEEDRNGVRRHYVLIGE